MNFISSVRTALLGRFSGLTKDQLRRDLLAGLNVATMALPLSMAFAIASGVNPSAAVHRDHWRCDRLRHRRFACPDRWPDGRICHHHL
jgi:hypothetical protein